MTSVLGEPCDSGRISAIIPVYNGERYLSEAIDSVLSQTLKPVEVIVVDDGSSDRSGDICNTYGNKIIRVEQENAGTAAARNKGVEVSTGELLAFLDQDDLWAEDKLEKQTRLMRRSHAVQLVWGRVQQFVSPELSFEFKKRFKWRRVPVPGYLPSAMLIRREAFLRVGAFNPKWRLGEWADWYTRYVQTGLVCDHVTEVVAYRRIHRGNKGISMMNDRGEYVRLIRENLILKKGK